MITAQNIIDALGLVPHPEGGQFRRTYCHETGLKDRGYASAIYYLLEGHEYALWHRTDGDEIWHWYAGAPLTLEVADKDNLVKSLTLGADILVDQRPQILVPANCWQRATSTGSWTLCGCTVSPGFDLEKFEMAPKGWHPTPA